MAILALREALYIDTDPFHGVVKAVVSIAVAVAGGMILYDTLTKE